MGFGQQPVKVQNPNAKWLVSNDKGTSARPLLAVIDPVFAFHGLPSAVFGPHHHGHECQYQS
jgi:hypothetical protein